MPLTWIEDNESRSATIVRLGKKAQSTYVKSWKIFGSTDDLVVHAEVNARIWDEYFYWQYPGQPQNQLAIDSYTLEYLGDDAWQLKATYTKEGAEHESGDDGGGADGSGTGFKRSRSFDTSGQTVHITQANRETRYPIQTAPFMNFAIGVDGDSVQGVDIVVPTFQWTESYDVPAAFVTYAYARTLAKLTGTVNLGGFRGFAGGEVLFLGASGSHEWDSQKGDGPWSLTYKFLASLNAGPGQALPAITAGDIMGIAKEGHEYLWVRYENSAAQGTLVKKPSAVYVNRVYDYQNFSQLGIGVN